MPHWQPESQSSLQLSTFSSQPESQPRSQTPFWLHEVSQEVSQVISQLSSQDLSQVHMLVNAQSVVGARVAVVGEGVAGKDEAASEGNRVGRAVAEGGEVEEGCGEGRDRSILRLSDRSQSPRSSSRGSSRSKALVGVVARRSERSERTSLESASSSVSCAHAAAGGAEPRISSAALARLEQSSSKV